MVKMDSDYLKNHLGQCLADCLTEVSEKRPLDPIEYIAQWLYKHIENVKDQKQAADDIIRLEKEKEEFALEEERKEKMKEEKKRLKAEEVEKQKELEAQTTTGLPTLAEGDEPQEPPRIEVSTEEEQAEETSPRNEEERGSGEEDGDPQQLSEEVAEEEEEEGAEQITEQPDNTPQQEEENEGQGQTAE